MRRTLPLAPALALGIALVVLAVGVTDWWNDRGASPGRADVGFYDDMTLHHSQALMMSLAYIRNGEDSTLRSIASEIDFTQAGDIRVMQDALSRWDEAGTPDVAMEWMGEGVAPNDMPGLASAADMNALTAERGRALDDLFTRLMIEHHAGGAGMADAAVERARLAEVRDLARAMAFTQRREIDELNHRRLDLGLPIVEPDPGLHAEHE